MKLKSNQIILIAGGVIFLFVIYAAMRAHQDSAPIETSAPADARPQMVVETTNVNMGTISNSQPTQYTMKIRNEGRAPLNIFSVQGSCPCITGWIDRNPILPGGFATLTIEMDPLKDVYSFDFHKSITIRSNDASLDFLLINVRGEIEPEFSLEPKMLDFGIIQKGQTVERTILLRQIQEEPLELKGLDTGAYPIEGLEFSFVERPQDQWTEPNKKEYIITGRLLPEAPTGRIAEYVKLITNCKRFPKGFPIVVAAQVESFFTTEPSRVLQLGKVTKGEQLSAKVTIYGAKTIAISELSYSGKELIPQYRLNDTKDQGFIDLTVAPDAPEGRIKGTLRFVVEGNGEKAPVSLTVFGLIQSGTSGS